MPYVTRIKWIDGENVQLPTRMNVPIALLKSAKGNPFYEHQIISEYLTSQTGWLVADYRGIRVFPAWPTPCAHSRKNTGHLKAAHDNAATIPARIVVLDDDEERPELSRLF